MDLKSSIIRLKWLPASILNKIGFMIRHTQVGSGTKIYGRIFVRGSGYIAIGNNVVINSCMETNPIGGDTKCILFAKDNGVIKIGDGCGISNSAIVAIKKIIIGEHVYIGGSCKIYDHDFHSVDLKERLAVPDPGIKSAAIEIKRGAFIGACTIILKGVTIGEESVVGAGSVVTKSIPDYEVWGGNPAKYIKSLK